MSTGGGGGGRRKKWHTLAGVLLVSLVAISALYVSLHKRSNVAQGGDSKEFSSVEVTKGQIFFDLKPLDNLCSSPGEADDLIGMGDVIKEAEWRILNTSLQCSHNKMILEVEGPGADDLELYHGDSCSLPQMCGFLTKGNTTSLTFIIDYEGCNVKQESGSFVVFLGWRKSPIKLVCAALPSPDPTIPSTTPELVKQFLEPTGPPKLWPHRRTKRFFRNRHRDNHRFVRYHYRPYVPCFYKRLFSIATTTEPPVTTTKSPLLNSNVWRKLLHGYTAQDTSPQNAIDQYDYPSQEDWHKLRKMAQQAMFQNYMHNAQGFHPHLNPLSNVVSKSLLLNPKQCRRRWFDGSCRDNFVGNTLNFPFLSRQSLTNKHRYDWQPVYNTNKRSNVIWDQLPWFKN